MLFVGSVVGTPSGSGDDVESPVEQAAVRQAPLAALQSAAESGPRDPARWSALGLAYVQQARLTADPSWFAKAEEALARSISLNGTDNAAALSGQAALAAGRHQFQEALRLADSALVFNDFSSTTYGVKVDALTELGRYTDALAAAQRMLQLQPGLDSYARISYAFELRGDLEKAKLALEEADRVAATATDKAFVRFYLGELAFSQGDLRTAAASYDGARRLDPDFLPAKAGRAKVMAAGGRTVEAIGEYRSVVAALPAPAYLDELGELLEATGRGAEAEEQYQVLRVLQQAFAQDGSDVDVELALFEADHGSKTVALRLARAAYLSRPRTVSVQDAYAWALHVNGRSAEALPIARQAVRLGSKNANYYARLGIIAAEAGAAQVARTSLRRALQLNPSFNVLLAPRARSLLAALD